MHCAHFGIAVFIIGVTLVNGYETERDVRMEVGSSVSVGGYDFRFNGVRDVVGPNYQSVMGEIGVLKDGEFIRNLHPEKRTYNASGMVMTEASIDTGLFRDLYVALGEPLANDEWVVRVYHKPFVDWIWLGCFLMALGGILAVTDRRYRLAIREKRKKGIARDQNKDQEEAKDKDVDSEADPVASGSALMTETEVRKV